MWCSFRKLFQKMLGSFFDPSLPLISCIKESIFWSNAHIAIFLKIKLYTPHEPIFQWKKKKKWHFFPRAEKWADLFWAWLTYFKNGTRSRLIKKIYFIAWPWNLKLLRKSTILKFFYLFLSLKTNNLILGKIGASTRSCFIKKSKFIRWT